MEGFGILLDYTTTTTNRITKIITLIYKESSPHNHKERVGPGVNEFY